MIFRNEWLTLKQWSGLAIGFFGFFPFLMAQAPLENSAIETFFLSTPELMLIVAVSAGAYGWIVMQKEIQKNTYSSVFLNGVSMLWGGIISLTVAYLTEPVFIKVTDPGAFWSYDIPMFAWYLGVLILITNIFCYNLYGSLLRTYSATFLALAGGMTPIFTALFDWIFLGELITWHFVVTIVLVFVGLLIFYSDELKKIRKKNVEA